MKTTFSLLGLLFAASLSCFAQQQVALFKNGKGFFMQQLNVSAEKGKTTIENLPQPHFGTFWALGTANNRIRHLQTYLQERPTEVPAEKFHDYLALNTGKNILLSRHGQENISGKIEQVTGNLLTLKTDKEWKIIDIQQITALQFTDKPKTVSEQKSMARVLEIAWEKPANKQALQLMYLQSDIGWLPVYRLELINETTARLSLQAEVQNDAEELQNATVNFVVGVPNFRFGAHNSILFGNEPLATLINRLNGTDAPATGRYRLDRQSMSNMVTQTYDSYSGGDDTPLEAPEGNTEEDLFFYTQTGISLPKGGRASYRLFEAEVPMKHIYEAQLPDNQERTETQTPPPVWHTLELDNKTAQPWTTGAALLLKTDDNKQRPLGQDMLNYTPPGTQSRVKITIAPDIQVRQSEKEVSREEKHKKYNDNYYDLLTIEGSITINNRKEKEVDMHLTRQIIGNLLNSSAAWEITKNISYYELLNFSNRVVWKVKAAAQSETTLTYRYQMYVRP